MKIIYNEPGIYSEYGTTFDVRTAENEIVERGLFLQQLKPGEMRRLNNYLSLKWGLAPVSRFGRVELWVWKWLHRLTNLFKK